jgi:hypothetical protein
VAIEPRSFKVQGRVTESTINKMVQLQIINPEFNESMQVNTALENMFVNRGINSELENMVFESHVKRSLLRLTALQNRVNMRRSGTELGVLVELLTVKIRENPKVEGIESDIKDLAVLVHEINSYSVPYYKMCLKTVRNLLKKSQKVIFNQKLDSCIHVSTGIHIIGGTLDTYENDLSELVNNCMTVPKNKREAKIDDTLHYITQNKENSNDLCKAFLSELERAEHVKN